jgi:hypothetical protein
MSDARCPFMCNFSDAYMFSAKNIVCLLAGFAVEDHPCSDIMILKIKHDGITVE